MDTPRIELIEARYAEMTAPEPDSRGNISVVVYLKDERQTALSINLN